MGTPTRVGCPFFVGGESAFFNRVVKRITGLMCVVHDLIAQRKN